MLWYAIGWSMWFFHEGLQNGVCIDFLALLINVSLSWLNLESYRWVKISIKSILFVLILMYDWEMIIQRVRPGFLIKLFYHLPSTISFIHHQTVNLIWLLLCENGSIKLMGRFRNLNANLILWNVHWWSNLAYSSSHFKHCLKQRIMS